MTATRACIALCLAGVAGFAIGLMTEVARIAANTDA